MASIPQKPLNYRLPPLEYTRPELPEGVDYTIDMGLTPRYGEWLIGAHDPEYYEGVVMPHYMASLRMIAGVGPDTEPADWGHWFRSAKKGPDFERWALMMLWMVCVHLDNEYLRVVAIDAVPDGTSITHEKIFLLDKPDSDIWNDDERLVLKFIDAMFNFRMTDDLFQAAVESWGPQFIFRSLGLLMYYYYMTLLFEATGNDRFPGLRGDKPYVEQTGWSTKATEGRSADGLG